MFTTAFVLRVFGLFVVLFLIVLGMIGLFRNQAAPQPEPEEREPTLLGEDKFQNFSLNSKNSNAYEDSE